MSCLPAALRYNRTSLTFVGDLPFDDLLAQLRGIDATSKTKAQELTAAIKAQHATGNHERPNDTVRQLVKEQRELRAAYLVTLRQLQRTFGITSAQMREYERAKQADELPTGNALWRTQVFEAQPTESLDTLATAAMQRLLGIVHPTWLEEQRQHAYRLDNAFRENPLHLVNGIRISTSNDTAPQRFARMLLVTQDHLAKRDDLDFFSAAMFVPEIAVLGNSLDEINQLGPEAQHKLATLPTLPDESVTATIYELLVGAASIRHGLSLTMIPEDRAAKVPDFRINSFETIPAVIECKRRLGLTNYELDEARQIETFYFPIRQYLHDHAIHGVIEASFAVEIQTVAREAFATDVINMVRTDRDHDTTPTSWGTLAFRRLAYYDTFRPTRLYSPNYLQRAFHWEPLQEAWDGLLCEVEPPSTVSVDSFRAPRCIKWRSESDTALTKKSRGILSLVDQCTQADPARGDWVYLYWISGRITPADRRCAHAAHHLVDGGGVASVVRSGSGYRD